MEGGGRLVCLKGDNYRTIVLFIGLGGKGWGRILRGFHKQNDELGNGAALARFQNPEWIYAPNVAIFALGGGALFSRWYDDRYG
jgi:hypothetical protein